MHVIQPLTSTHGFALGQQHLRIVELLVLFSQLVCEVLLATYWSPTTHSCNSAAGGGSAAAGTHLYLHPRMCLCLFLRMLYLSLQQPHL